MDNKIIKITTKVITTLFSIITVLLLLLALYNFFSVKLLKKDFPNIFGYTFFEVISGSMSPNIEKMDLILVKIDTDYNIGDVISYKKDGAIITHRIVEKKDETYVTKGDANNTVDNPINESMIIGKVIKKFSGLAVWIKVLTDPKVIICAITSVLLLGYTISLFKKQSIEKIKQLEEERINNKEEYMKKILNNTKLKVELCIFFILLIAMLILIPYTLSRFKTEARTVANLDIAFFIANDEYTHEDITLTEMLPGDSNSYTFSVSNFKDENRTEVNLKYEIEVITTTNLPLEYELYLINSANEVPIEKSDEVIEDDDHTYFRTITSTEREFNFENNATDYYKLTIKFPMEYKSSKYQDTVENIEINVNAKQKLDIDN